MENRTIISTCISIPIFQVYIPNIKTFVKIHIDQMLTYSEKF